MPCVLYLECSFLTYTVLMSTLFPYLHSADVNSLLTVSHPAARLTRQGADSADPVQANSRRLQLRRSCAGSSSSQQLAARMAMQRCRQTAAAAEHRCSSGMAGCGRVSCTVLLSWQGDCNQQHQLLCCSCRALHSLARCLLAGGSFAAAL